MESNAAFPCLATPAVGAASFLGLKRQPVLGGVGEWPLVGDTVNIAAEQDVGTTTGSGEAEELRAFTSQIREAGRRSPPLRHLFGSMFRTGL